DQPVAGGADRARLRAHLVGQVAEVLRRDRGAVGPGGVLPHGVRSEEHTSELQSRENLVCRLLLEKKKKRYLSAISTAKVSAPLTYSTLWPSSLPPITLILILCSPATTDLCTHALHDALPI